MLSPLERIKCRKLLQLELEQYIQLFWPDGSSYGPRLFGDNQDRGFNAPTIRMFEDESAEPLDLPLLQCLTDTLAAGPVPEDLIRYMGDIYSDLFIARARQVVSPLKVPGRRLYTCALHVEDTAKMSTATLAYILGSAAGLAWSLSAKSHPDYMIYTQAPRLYVAQDRWSLTFTGAVRYAILPLEQPALEGPDGQE